MSWEYGPVQKLSGLWGWFETHIETGRQRFVAKSWRTKDEAVKALNAIKQAKGE